MSTAPKNDRTLAATEAQALVIAGGTGALGTLDRQSGTPYVSLVTVACTPDGAPVLLLSGLAMHTRNLIADSRASLLYSAGRGADDPLTLARVTLLGTLERTSDAAARAAYLLRHPQASDYADFGDFAFYLLKIERAHFIGGFGRIVELSRSDFAGA
ncbi:MAG: pyridoxamine 5'-phosphate oxidase family protein [Hyphomicrobiaceae bacterium]